MMSKNYIKEVLVFIANVCGSICLFCFAIILTINIHASEVKDTVAVVGNKSITLNDFNKLYKEKISKIGLNDNVDVRQEYLMNLVGDELLIQKAKLNGLDKTEESKKQLRRIKLQELLNSYSDKHISPTLNISETDLKELFVRLNTKIKVSHLYASTKGKADSLYNELKKGKKFDNLVKETFNDPVLKNNGGSLGYITADEMDPDFEEVAFAMHVGEISKPVKTVQGYSIIKIDDIKRNVLVTENEYLKAQDRIKKFARKRAYEKAAKEFSNSLRKKLNTTFNEALIDKLFEIIQQNSLQYLIESNSAITKSDLNKTSVNSALGKWNLSYLLEEMSIVTEKQQKWIKTKENLQDLIAGLINRKWIEQQAIKENLDKDKSYIDRISYNFDTYLLTSLENKIKDGITVSADTIKRFYKNNLNLFNTPAEIRLSSILIEKESIADSVFRYLQSGIAFEELSKKYSVQTLTAQKNGDMGYFSKKELGELGDKIFQLKAGEWAGPFVDEDKFLFLKCTNYKNAGTKPFEECEKEIEETIRMQNFYAIRESLIESYKKEFGCKIFLSKLNEIKL